MQFYNISFAKSHKVVNIKLSRHLHIRVNFKKGNLHLLAFENCGFALQFFSSEQFLSISVQHLFNVEKIAKAISFSILKATVGIFNIRHVIEMETNIYSNIDLFCIQKFIFSRNRDSIIETLQGSAIQVAYTISLSLFHLSVPARNWKLWTEKEWENWTSDNFL